MLKEKLPLFNRTLNGISLNYRKGWSGESLAEAIQSSNQRDYERGSTGPGPHKADLVLTLDGVPAKERLSRGEQKAMTAAMIMAQAELISTTGEKPLLMLDDLASELDEEHLAKVLESGLDLGVQICLTGTDLAAAIDTREDGYTMFHVEQGRVSSHTR
jgi:DNA replication and repair protein RecF